MQGMKYVFLSAAIVAFSSVSCEAEIFKWIDEKGKVHFTDSTLNISKKLKGDAQNELGVTSQNKSHQDRADTKGPDSVFGKKKPIDSRVKEKKLDVAKLSNRQKDLLRKLEVDIKDLREKLMASESQYFALKNESIKVSQEAFNDMDYSGQHREARHELQRRAYELDQEHIEARAAYFDVKEKLKYRENQLEEFLRSLDE